MISAWTPWGSATLTDRPSSPAVSSVVVRASTYPGQFIFSAASLSGGGANTRPTAPRLHRLRRPITEFVGTILKASRTFLRSRVQFLQEPARGHLVTLILRSLMFHKSNYGASDVGKIRESVGEIRNVEC